MLIILAIAVVVCCMVLINRHPNTKQEDTPHPTHHSHITSRVEEPIDTPSDIHRMYQEYTPKCGKEPIDHYASYVNKQSPYSADNMITNQVSIIGVSEQYPFTLFGLAEKIIKE